MTRWPGHAVLQVPVPPLEPFVRVRYEVHDPSLVGAGESFVHAHVTVIGPFDELPAADQVARLARRLRPFDARLDGVRTFPNGIIHAPAAPAQHFEEFTRAACEAFPGVLPYRGHFEVTPHVTLEAVAPGVDEQVVAAWLEGVLPGAFRADALDLVWYEQGNSHLVQRHRLG